jgi:predicted lactoylglutathione lyase
LKPTKEDVDGRDKPGHDEAKCFEGILVVKKIQIRCRDGLRPFVLGSDHAKGAPMAKLIFVNLPVSDLARATAFYQAVGAEKNEQFCDGTASCMVFSDTIHAMLLTHDKFRQFTPKKIADAKTSSEVLICISADSRDAVDDVVGKAQAAGGGVDPCPKQDYGFMYGRSFEDPDGHIWEVMWMDVAAATAAQSAMADA